jgi:hypothetical protein
MCPPACDRPDNVWWKYFAHWISKEVIVDKVCRNIYHFVGDTVILKGLLKKQVFWFYNRKNLVGSCPLIPIHIRRSGGLVDTWEKESFKLDDYLEIIMFTSQSRKKKGCLSLISNMENQFSALRAGLKKLPQKSPLWIMSNFWAQFFHVFMV